MKEQDLSKGTKVKNSQTGEAFSFLRMDAPFAVVRDRAGEETLVHPSHLEPDGRHSPNRGFHAYRKGRGCGHLLPKREGAQRA